MKTIRLSLTRKIWPVLILFMGIMQIAQPRKIWMMLFTGLSVLFGLSYVWTKLSAQSLDLSREMRFGWSHVGDPLQERFYLTNQTWIPAPWIAVRDHSNLAGYEGSTVTSIGPNDGRFWYKRGICGRRGLYTIGPTTIQTGDPFGIFTAQIDYLSTAQMMVLPPVVHLPEIDIAPGGKIGGGLHVSPSMTRTVSASGVREFEAGDSLRYIHWPTTVRTGEYYVRSFDSTPSSDHWIFLDLNKNVQVGSGDKATQEHAIILAASLADQGLKDGKAVGLAAHGEKVLWLPPLLEESQKWRILRSLALVKLGEESIKSLLKKTAPSIKSQTSLILITSDIKGDWMNQLILLTQRGIFPSVLLMDKTAFGGDGNLSSIEQRLLELGIRYFLIRPDFLDAKERKPRELKEDRWRVREKTRDLWRVLT